MATPQGAVSKLFFRPETTYGTDSIGAGSASIGFLNYFDRVSVKSAKTPLDFGEISGLSTDFSAFEEGGIDVGLDIEFAMRYYGAHIALIGLGMGTMVTTGTIPVITHAATLQDALFSSTFKYQVPVTNNSTFNENILTGCSVQRMTLSHRAGDVMRCRLEMLASGLTYNSGSIATPPSAAGRTPTDPLISWSHKENLATSTAVIRSGFSLVEINIRSWEVTLDNKLEPNFLIQTGRSGGQPQRSDFREVRMRLEIEQNAGWREFLTAYGDSPTGTTSDFGVRLDYQSPTSANEAFLVRVSNCRTLDVQRNTETAGKMYQQVEMRGHFKSGSTNFIPAPLEVTMNNTKDVPYDEAPLG